MTLIYKILPRALWDKAQRDGVFAGAAIDLQDGYIHLSTAEQARETAQKHFHGQDDLTLVAFSDTDFHATLKWEVSRGNALFPHIYGMIDPKLARHQWPLRWVGTYHDFPELPV
jgi:uncharacterized protein (DUF952 family)